MFQIYWRATLDHPFWHQMPTFSILVKENLKVNIFSLPVLSVVLYRLELGTNTVMLPLAGDSRRLDTISEGLSFEEFGSE